MAVVLERPDFWDDPAFVGRVSYKNGEVVGKTESMNRFEQN